MCQKTRQRQRNKCQVMWEYSHHKISSYGAITMKRELWNVSKNILVHSVMRFDPVETCSRRRSYNTSKKLIAIYLPLQREWRTPVRTRSESAKTPIDLCDCPIKSMEPRIVFLKPKSIDNNLHHITGSTLVYVNNPRDECQLNDEIDGVPACGSGQEGK